ncbi:MAG TPA: TonB-dependent receptor [Lacibacter sp.]|nr:TonB-dependent receptor [Lacibacter sp.]
MRKLASILVLALVCSMHVLAQERTVTGKVTDEKDGLPLAGVSITVKGTTIGTTTGTDGRFTLSLPSAARTLVISFVNYATQEVAIGSRTEFAITMVNEEKALSEVVVVGFGTQRKKDVTAAIGTIGGDKIKNVPVQSFEQALSGKAAGLNVILPNGVLNNPPVIRIRGVNSVQGSSFPLVIIDGVPSFNGDISTNLSANNVLGNLNPADIEDIQVLKDAAAAAIYGSRAANGVMLITTKKGKAGKARVTYDAWVGWTSPFKLFDVLNAQDYVQIKNEAIRNNPGAIFSGHVPGSPLFFLDTINGKMVETNWADEVYQTGVQHNHTLSISGANAGTKYFFSGNYTKQDGMIQTNTFERYQMRMNIEHKVNTWLTVGSNLNFSRGITQSPSTGSLPGTPFNTSGAARLAFVTAPNVSPYLPDGRYNIVGIDNPTQRNTLNQIGRNKNLINSGFVNPVMIRDLNKISSTSDQFQGSIFADIKITKGLNFRTQYGLNWTTSEDKTFWNSLHGDGVQQTSTTADDGSAFNVTGKYNISNFQNYLTYNFSVKENHNFNLTAGSEEQRTTIDRWGAQRSGLTDQSFNEYQGTFTQNDNPVGNLITENYLLSFFGRANYNYKNRYYLSGTFRRDGYSAFAQGKKWGNFAGGSVAWNVSDEAFWKGGLSKVLSSFRIRASYGQVGNLTAVGNFASLSTFGSALYGLGYSTIFFNQAGNPNLTWETSTKFDAGFQFGFLNDRITGEFSYYNTDLSDLILDLPLPSSLGVPGNSYQVNAASMYNRGVEFSLNAKIIDKKDFSWNASFNITTQKNEVTSLFPGVTEIIGNTQLERTNITRVGLPIGSFFVVKTNGVDPATGQRIFLDAQGREVLFNFAAPVASRWRYRDGTVAPPISLPTDGKVVGQPLPKAYGGIVNNFYYKNFDVTIDAFYSLGNYVYFGSRAGMLDQRFWNNFQEVKNRWTKPGDVTNIPRIVYNDNISNGSAIPMDINLFKADFLRIRSLSLGYTLPKKLVDRAKLSSLRLYVQMLNPFIFTSYPGVDPEISVNGNNALTPGVDRNTVGQARTITVGLNLGF